MTMRLQMRPAPSSRNIDFRPSVDDFRDDNRWVALARSHWLDTTVVRAADADADAGADAGAGAGAADAVTFKSQNSIVKRELWDPLEAENFSLRSLLVLENLHILEKYLWPSYTEEASNYHVLLIAVIVGVKHRESLPIWGVFEDRPTDFSGLFRRVLSMNLDFSLPIASRKYLLQFVISAFQSLESSLIRKECAPLVSVSIWNNLHSEDAQLKLLNQPHGPKKAWKIATKKYDAADAAGKARLHFERSWLFSMLVEFIRMLNDEKQTAEIVHYCEQFMEFLIDIISQLPTRRYVNSLLKDLNLIPIIRLSKAFNEQSNALFRDFHSLLKHFMLFAVEDQSGRHLTVQEVYSNHCRDLAHLQRNAIKHFKDKLTLLALSNYGSIEQREELLSHIGALDDDELKHFSENLGFRTVYPNQAGIDCSRQLLTEMLLSHFKIKPSYQETTLKLSVLPTETILYEPVFLRNETFEGSHPLAIPKLSLQYLSMGDFLWRSFLIYRSEAFYDIRNDLEAVVHRMSPKLANNTVAFDGFSRMAIPIAKPAIIEVGPPDVGSVIPAYVRSELTLNVSRLGDRIRREWESLRPGDTVFLLGVQSETPATSLLTRTASKVGLVHIRTAEIVRILDERGRIFREDDQEQNQEGFRRHTRFLRFIVNIDAAAYKADVDNLKKGGIDVYSRINLICRRKGRENNFKSVMESMQALTTADAGLPAWFQDVFLGYGDPTSASHTFLENKIKSIDFRDTFLDWHHLKESFPAHEVKTIDPETSGPPFVLHMFSENAETAPAKSGQKRRRDKEELTESPSKIIRVSSYRPVNQGPYSVDAPRLNQIRFTPAQVSAIASGVQPGLTVVVGPPGTGKTDVATQIINNIYHNFPQERTLLITHSNQALNQLFQKIVALDIDERHLLRLGRGEEELDTDVSYSKYGRIDTLLEKRVVHLQEVMRLASSIGVEGAHGNTCETAGYFNAVYVQPMWARYWDKVQESDDKRAVVLSGFPFYSFFADAPQPLLPDDASEEKLVDIALGCKRHIDRLFSELQDIRPFEILRQQKDKANYLLMKEARIIAMTSTHAAMRRQEIVDLGFRYDNVVIEEAAQITEIESFIPLTLQTPIDGEFPLKRVVLCGDHLQNSPVVRNAAFRHYAKFDQTMFTRLVRLGVPTIMLDKQGRSRPSIADLFRWRYKHLGDLPTIEQNEEFKLANAGLKYDYQFINVPDYQGSGEIMPIPHFIQNLGEAEYAVALYQYMRLLGYPAKRISILATYAGQQSLIKDVLNHRCSKNRLFGLPRVVTTVDKYQGEQNDYVILSLTRTRSVGYLRDVRRLTVALSRARLGLYILGRREVFESCLELKPAFDILFKRPDKLEVVPGELFPAKRLLTDDVAGTAMESVEHIGQYVYEMTQAKLNDIKAREPAIPADSAAELEEEAGEEDIDMEDAL
ncbi:hypothetical protein KEM54_004164 [Ascosphaera aggregata]|nr:hypothetical protein KEM54_004164 [Ascosphaera aggregata]